MFGDTQRTASARNMPPLSVDVDSRALQPRADAHNPPTPILRGTHEDPASLKRTWETMLDTKDVLLFHGHSDENVYGYMSNFYQHDEFAFTIPAWCGVYAGRKTTPIAFAEKAIMLCKASLMGDEATYARIEAAESPSEAKRLGRAVVPWNEGRWQGRVCEIARYVIEAKFTQVEGLDAKLLATGDRLIAEAAPRDKMWGIGLGANSEDALRPSAWKGANILGWALMMARDTLESTSPPPVMDDMNEARPCKRAKT